MIAIVCVVCLFFGALFGYCIAEKQSQHAIFAARAKGLVEGRTDAQWDYHNMFQELQSLRRRNRQLEAKEQVIRRDFT